MRPLAPMFLLLGLTGCDGCQRPELPTASREPVRVEVAIRNDRDAPIWLAEVGTCQPSVVAVEGLETVREMSLECEAALRGDCPDEEICAPAPPTLLEPGATVRAAWGGGAYRRLAIDDPDEGCPEDCVVWLPVDPGDYTLVVRAHGACPDGCQTPPLQAPDLRATSVVTLPETASGPVRAEVRFD